MFRNFLILALLFLCGPVMAQQTVSVAPVFLSALQDIPLPPGLVEMTEQTAVFDKPEGRIVEAVAEMNDLTEVQVEKFYGDTLPQLGWERQGTCDFIRQQHGQAEHLHIGFEALEGRHYVRFALSPGK